MPYCQDKLRVMLEDHLSHSDDFRWWIVVELIQVLELFNKMLVDLISD